MTTHQAADLFLIGTNHRLSPVQTRERLAMTAAETGAWLAELASSDVMSAALVLATCHRVEIYAITSAPSGAERAIRQGIMSAHGRDLLAPSPETYLMHGPRAVEHLCRVAAGLDSLVLGEVEIAGQLRRAAAMSRAAGAFDRALEVVVAGALRAGGRARAETDLGRGALSVAGAAISLIERELGGLAGRGVLIVGAGEAGREAAVRAAARQPAALVVASRTERHARAVADRAGGRTVPLDTAADLMTGVDAVVVAIDATGFRLDAARCAATTAARTRPLVIVDLSVPRAVDAGVGALDAVSLFSVDDLGDIVTATATRRQRAVPRAEAIVVEEAARVHARLIAATRPARRDPAA